MKDQEIFSFEKKNRNSVLIHELLNSILDNWYWFVISITVCLTAAYSYAKSEPQVYRATAEIMIKTGTQGQAGQLTESTLFADMGLNGAANNVEGEIYVLGSSSLIDQVVRRLGIDVTYSVRPILRVVDIYDTTPVRVSFADKELMEGFTMEIAIVDSLSYDYKIIGVTNDDEWKNARYGDTISVARGRFAVDKTPYFEEKYDNGNITVQVNSIDDTIDSILGNLLIVKADKITDVLRLTLDDSNFRRAKDILNMLILVYNEEVINDKNRVATNTERFIIERIAAISQDLGGIDRQIEQLKKDNNIPDFGSIAGTLLQTDEKHKEDIIAIDTEINLAQFIRSYISDPAKQSEFIPANTGISDLGIESQIAKYNEEQLRLNKLLVNSGINNPVTTDLIKTLNVTRENMIRSIDNFLSLLRIKRDRAVSQANIDNRRIAAVPTQEKLANDVVRQQKIKEELYLYLLNKREENALQLAITESNAKIIESADGSSTPIMPVMSRFLALAFIVGLILPAAIIFLVRFLDNKVRTKADIEREVSIPILGELPRKSKNQRDSEIVVSENSRDHISEAFRIIRSNIDFFVKTKKGANAVIQLTSTRPSEGKTYITINLAFSFAYTGKRVVLVDLDLRRSELSKILGKGIKTGVSTFLSGRTEELDHAIIKGVQGDNVDFIPAGIIPPNPANLLMSDRFEVMIQELRKRYDYIFLDTVPAMVVADAVIINRVADITLYVIRNGKIDRRYLQELEKIYKEGKFNNMNIVLSDVNMDKRGYGYLYGYVEEKAK